MLGLNCLHFVPASRSSIPRRQTEIPCSVYLDHAEPHHSLRIWDTDWNE
jgi:hypothetical protein